MNPFQVRNTVLTLSQPTFSCWSKIRVKRNNLNFIHFPLPNWITVLGNNIRTYERGQHARCIPMSCSVLFKLRNRFKNMTKTELLMCSRYSSQEINLTCLYVLFLYTIFNRSWSGLGEIKSARRHVNFHCWKTILPSKFYLHTQVSFSILSSRRCTMPPKHIIFWILK